MISRSFRRRAWRAIGRFARPVASVVVAAMVASPVAGAREPAPRRPDLRMAPPRDLRVCGSPMGGDFQHEDCPTPTEADRWLRFGSLVMNVGEGPLELVATRATTEVDHMHAVQRIAMTDGSWRTRPTGTLLHWAEAEDGHPHWHAQGLERYRLFRLPAPIRSGARVGVKRGYCVFDGRIVRPELRVVPSAQAYPFASCGELGESHDLLGVRTGLSVGWGDEYAWDYAGQRVPIDGAGDGTYLLCLTVDPEGQIRETRERNNESWARIRLRTVEDDAGQRVEVSVRRRGVGPCRDHVPYRIAKLPRPGGLDGAVPAASAVPVASAVPTKSAPPMEVPTAIPMG
jgi:hypothetical protein